METLLFCLPRNNRTACYTDNSDNFSLTGKLDHTVSRYSYIYLWEAILQPYLAAVTATEFSRYWKFAKNGPNPVQHVPISRFLFPLSQYITLLKLATRRPFYNLIQLQWLPWNFHNIENLPRKEANHIQHVPVPRFQFPLSQYITLLVYLTRCPFYNLNLIFCRNDCHGIFTILKICLEEGATASSTYQYCNFDSNCFSILDC